MPIRLDITSNTIVPTPEEYPAILGACKRGLLYEEKGDRSIALIQPWDDQKAIGIIQDFRGAAYTLNGPIPAVTYGQNVHAKDASSYHLIVVDNGNLIGCARYTRLFQPKLCCWAELGGFVIAPQYRGSRVVLGIIAKLTEMASLFGDKRFFAHASVQHGSASVLRKLGWRTIARYYEPSYERDVEVEVMDYRIPTK